MSVGRGLVRVLLGTAMVGRGICHLTVAREEFRAQVPSWFPVDEDMTVLTSGVVVVLGAALVALPKRRRLVGTVLGAFYVAVLPGNIAHYTERRYASGSTPTASVWPGSSSSRSSWRLRSTAADGSVRAVRPGPRCAPLDLGRRGAGCQRLPASPQ